MLMLDSGWHSADQANGVEHSDQLVEQPWLMVVLGLRLRRSFCGARSRHFNGLDLSLTQAKPCGALQPQQGRWHSALLESACR
jgi:hypothetical protein